MATQYSAFRRAGMSKIAGPSAVVSLYRDSFQPRETEPAGAAKRTFGHSAILATGGYKAGAMNQPVDTRANDDIGMRFGRRLRMLRKSRNLTQLQMADAFGIDRSYISDVERGAKGVSLATLEVIALGFAIELSELVSEL